MFDDPQKEAQEQRQHELLRFQNDVFNVINNEHGRRVMAALLIKSGVFSAASVADTEENAMYREGRRSIGLEIIGMASAEEPVFIELMKEVRKTWLKK